MKYRVISPCDDKKTYTNIHDAISVCHSKEYLWGYAWIEQKVGNRWKRMSELEIEKAKLTYVEIKTILIPTTTANYKFVLPKPVQVPNNMKEYERLLFVIMNLLGIEPEIEEKGEKDE